MPEKPGAENPEQVAEKNPDFETFNKIREILRTHPHVNFTIAARGNVTADPKGDDKGARRFQFNKSQNKMVILENRLSGLDTSTWWLKMTKEDPQLFKKFPYFGSYPDTFLLGFKQYQVGDAKGRYNTDVRRGAFFAGFEAVNDKKLYSPEETEALQKIINLRESDPEQFIQMIDALYQEYAPAYYEEQEKVEQRIKANLR